MIDLDNVYPAAGPVARLEGREWHFRPTIGSRRLARVMDGVAEKGELNAVNALEDFVIHCLADNEREAMRSLFEEDVVGNWQLLELYRSLLEHYSAGRPTPPSSGSSGGPATNGTGSTPASSSPAAPGSVPSAPTWAVS